MPHFARASFDSLRGLTATAPLSMATETPSGTTSDSSPFWPLIFTVWPETVAVTPDGTATASLPIRAMPVLPWLGSRAPCRSEDLAEHFPAHVPLSRLVIGHHALRRRDDGDAEAVGDARHRVDRRVDAASGLRHPLHGADHRLAVEVFQLDVELGAAVAELGRRAVADEAFGLKHGR